MIQLGLIGEGISRSSAPRLHEFLGKMHGLLVSYVRIDSKEIPAFVFPEALKKCGESGFRGVNVTHPFKERVRSLIEVPDPDVARIGAINTVVFEPGPSRGFNTDFSGFYGAFRHRFGDASPGKVLIVGAGGVGRAMSFSLARLGADEIWLYDIDAQHAGGLSKTLKEAGINTTVIAQDDFGSAVREADGLINGTPIGMWTNPGNPFPADAIGGQRWAFDAVYTPIETEFLQAAKAGSLDIMSGYDLFLFQGFDAFEIFTGIRVDPTVAMAEFPPPRADAPNAMAN